MLDFKPHRSTVAAVKCPPSPIDLYQDLANQVRDSGRYSGITGMDVLRTSCIQLNPPSAVLILATQSSKCCYTQEASGSHTLFSHLCLLGRENQPQCTYCDDANICSSNIVATIS